MLCLESAWKVLSTWQCVCPRCGCFSVSSALTSTHCIQVSTLMSSWKWLPWFQIAKSTQLFCFLIFWESGVKWRMLFTFIPHHHHLTGIHYFNFLSIVFWPQSRLCTSLSGCFVLHEDISSIRKVVQYLLGCLTLPRYSMPIRWIKVCFSAVLHHPCIFAPWVLSGFCQGKKQKVKPMVETNDYNVLLLFINDF